MREGTTTVSTIVAGGTMVIGTMVSRTWVLAPNTRKTVIPDRKSLNLLYTPDPDS
jgi:hypothetical protein